MKKGLLAIAAGLFLLTSCNDQVKGVSADSNEEAKRNTENTKEVYRAIETGDVSKLDSFFSKDVVDHEGNMGKDIVGVDSVKAFLGNIHKYFDNLKMEMLSDATSTDGVYYFSLVRMTGKSKENPWGMPVGMDVDDTSVDVIKIKDGKATDHWSFTSMKDMMEMMSQMPGDMQPSKTDTTKAK
jgi:ketosteroid isomerase-like protein